MLLAVTPALAQERPRITLEFEGAPAWQSRNEVRIPNDTGTRFSLVDTIGDGPAAATRLTFGVDLNERHGLLAVVAPLEIRSRGSIGTQVRFAGTTFAPGTIDEAVYRFSSYRVTYRYRFYDGDVWQWKVGFTGFIRDARIALRQGQVSAEDTDVGFVPLAHLAGQAALSERWTFRLEADALGAAQGRAIDLAAKLAYAPSDRWEMAAGYRTIEGGADVEQVYNFAWLHFATASIRLRF